MTKKKPFAKFFARATTHSMKLAVNQKCFKETYGPIAKNRNQYSFRSDVFEIEVNPKDKINLFDKNLSIYCFGIEQDLQWKRFVKNMK